MAESQFKSMIGEIEAGLSIIHPCVIQVVGYYIPTRQMCGGIILELGKMNLETLIKQIKSGEVTLSEEQKRIIVIGMVLGMRWIEGLKIFHRDLKPSNIILTANYEPKIGDFGSSRRTETTDMTKGIGTVRYMAPEAHDGKYDKADVYSIGLIINELWTLEVPFPDSLPIRAGMRAMAGERPEIAETCPYASLIAQCIIHDPAQRPTFDELAKMVCRNLGPSELSYVEKIQRGELLTHFTSAEIVQKVLDLQRMNLNFQAQVPRIQSENLAPQVYSPPSDKPQTGQTAN